MAYAPKQRDIVWIDFDPSLGHEIKKRRPAVVISSTPYNRSTDFVIVCPITSTVRDNPSYVKVNGEKIHGQVVTTQIYSFDATSHGNRHIDFIEKMQVQDFYLVAQLVLMDFNFNL